MIKAHGILSAVGWFLMKVKNEMPGISFVLWCCISVQPFQYFLRVFQKKKKGKITSTILNVRVGWGLRSKLVWGTLSGVGARESWLHPFKLQKIQ